MANAAEAKDWAREHMKGLWTSPMYPFTPDFKLDEAGIRHNVDYMIGCKAAGLGFGFSEPWVVSREERTRAFETAVDAANKRVPAYVHTTDHSVEETIAFTRRAAAIGADAVMVWAPFEWAKTQEMVCQFFEYVASKTDIAIFLYNTWHSGICMTPETVERLSRIPAVCALKDAVNDVAHTVRCWELCGDRIVISDPLEEHLLVTTLHFDQQVLLGTTPVFLMQSPQCQPIQQYWELARAGKGAEAAKLFYELQPLRSIWTEMYQVLWNKDGALHPLPFIKHWMDQMGMRAGPVRPPMTNLTAAEKARFNDRLAASGWMERLVPGWPAST